MLQAALLDCPFLDLFPFSENGFVAPEVDVCRCDVVQALVVSFVVVVVDECPDLSFEITGKVIVFQENPVLHGLVPSLDLALGLGVEWCTAHVIHLPIAQPFGQVARDVAGSIVAEQTWLVTHNCLVATRSGQCQLNRVGHIGRPHVCAKLPGHDVAAVIVQDRAEIIPTPADDLEVGEVCLPHLVDGLGFVVELISGFDHYMLRLGDQISGLQ